MISEEDGCELQIILHRKSWEQLERSQRELPGRALQALWAGCALPSGNPGPSCFGISCFLLGFVCLFAFEKKKKKYKLFCYGFIPEC